MNLQHRKPTNPQKKLKTIREVVRTEQMAESQILTFDVKIASAMHVFFPNSVHTGHKTTKLLKFYIQMLYTLVFCGWPI